MEQVAVTAHALTPTLSQRERESNLRGRNKASPHRPPLGPLSLWERARVRATAVTGRSRLP
jgi:hypothetical protein